MKLSIVICAVFAVNSFLMAPPKKSENSVLYLDKQRINNLFLTAAKEGSVTACRNLLTMKVNCNALDDNNNSALMYAIAPETNTAEIVDFLLSCGVNPNTLNMQKFGPLLVATELGKQEVVQKLIAHGADVNAQTSDGVTPLMKAVMGKDTTLVRILLDAGAKDLQDKNGFTALMSAIVENNKEAVQMLIDAKFDLNLVNSCDHTALFFAIDATDETFAKMLIEHGAKIDRINKSTIRPLMYASWLGNNVAVKQLLHAGADVNAKNKYGCTALMHALAKDKYDVVETLVAHGADPKIKDSKGRSALMIAKKDSDKKESVFLRRCLSERLEKQNDKKILQNFFQKLLEHRNNKHQAAQLEKQGLADSLEQKNKAVVLRKFYQDLHDYQDYKFRKNSPSPTPEWADVWDETDENKFENLSAQRQREFGQ